MNLIPLIIQLSTVIIVMGTLGFSITWEESHAKKHGRPNLWKRLGLE